MRRLGCPSKEDDNILRHLRPRARCAILVFDEAIRVQWWRHTDETAREVGVVIQTSPNVNSIRWITVAIEKCENVVNTLVLGGRVYREVRRVRSAICIPCSLLVRIWRWKGIGENPWTLEHLALVVGAICDIIHRRDLLHALLWINLVDEVPKMKLVHGVASGTHLPINFVAAAHAWNVHSVEDRLKPKGIARRMWWILVIAFHR
mmetsp:Transcript_118771/g.185428  ORF Transcript_118771/g.185428 Transcript_118771/m.185428 type:complete len:205 (-) Transcript_118771:114-728(-)